MKNKLKLILGKSSLGKYFLFKIRHFLNTTYYLRKLKFKKFKQYSDLFEYYYEKNIWGNTESVSGYGSTINYTENLRNGLEKVIIDFEIKSIIDAPCGDFNWMNSVNLENVNYWGFDIVKNLILRNKELYERENVKFSVLDIITDNIPKADLWICRDVLFHFSNDDIDLVIKNFQKSEVKYILTTTYRETILNENIKTGEFRELNLEIEPFCFPKPILIIDDSNNGEVSGRVMGLWSKDNLVKNFNRNFL